MTMTINALNQLSRDQFAAMSHDELVAAIMVYQAKYNKPDSVKNKILEALAGDAHLSIAELAEACGTSAAVISSNLSYLKKAGTLIATDPLGKKFLYVA